MSSKQVEKLAIKIIRETKNIFNKSKNTTQIDDLSALLLATSIYIKSIILDVLRRDPDYVAKITDEIFNEFILSFLNKEVIVAAALKQLEAENNVSKFNKGEKNEL